MLMQLPLMFGQACGCSHMHLVLHRSSGMIPQNLPRDSLDLCRRSRWNGGLLFWFLFGGGVVCVQEEHGIVSRAHALGEEDGFSRFDLDRVHKLEGVAKSHSIYGWC